MRIVKVLFVLTLVVALGACSCRTRKVGDGDNIGSVGTASELNDINFAFDSYALDGQAKTLLQKNAAWLQKNSSAIVQVEGHCDERGTNEYNMVLGANRARAAQDYLRSQGVSADRLSTVSYGEELPLDTAHNEAAWAKNRRNHFIVQK